MTAIASSFEEKLKKKTSVVILSPHLDDSVLSAGNLIIELMRRGYEAQVVNFFTKGSTLATQLTSKLLKQSNCESADSYFELRKEEDVKALKILGVENILNFDLTDAAWRGDSMPFYPVTTLDIFHPDDQKTVEIVKEKMSELEIKDSLIIAPLARGRHVDHVIIRDCARELFGGVIHFMDMPYAGNFPQEEEFIKNNGLIEVRIEAEGLLKEQAISEYGSQKMGIGDYEAIDSRTETFYFNP
jgi:LmbE family N-acetylglucosaminyl deacetylase